MQVPTQTPSLARSLVTVLLPLFATQMLAPSKAMPMGLEPALNVPKTAPSLARSLVTVLLSLFVTQMLAPSKATPAGVPTGKVAGDWYAGNHFSSATCCGFTAITPSGPALTAVACVLPSGNVSMPPVPLIFMFPATSSSAPGVLVPMPTLPPARTNCVPAAKPSAGSVSAPLSAPPASCR